MSSGRKDLSSLFSFNISLGRSRSASLPLLLSVICAHFFINHEGVEFDSWHSKSSSVCGIVDASVFEFFFDFKSLLLFFHNFFCGLNTGVCGKIFLLNGFNFLLIFFHELFELIIVHLSDGTEFVTHITVDTLSVEVLTNLLGLHFHISCFLIKDLHNLCVRVNIFSCCKVRKSRHTLMYRINHFSTNILDSSVRSSVTVNESGALTMTHL